jgi:hypothetical protein
MTIRLDLEVLGLAGTERLLRHLMLRLGVLGLAGTEPVRCVGWFGPWSKEFGLWVCDAIRSLSVSVLSFLLLRDKIAGSGEFL